jgi:transmembrane sensor
MTSESNQVHSADDAYWERLARVFSGEASPREAEEAKAALAARPVEAMAITRLDELVSALGAEPARDIDVEAALARSRERRRPAVSTTTSPRFTWRPTTAAARWALPLRMAAGIAVVVAGGVLFRGLGGARGGEEHAVVYRVVDATPDTLTLGDGSVVVLAPRSELTVPPGFGTDGRDVTLSGLGYFNVKHDEQRPFVVRAGGAEVRDLGTAFGVRADAGVPVQVVVREGTVRVTDAASPNGFTLQAGDRVTMGARPELTRGQGPEATAEAVAWTSGRLVFRDVAVSEVAQEIARWYGVRVVAEDGLASARVFVDFEGQREGVGAFLEKLRLSLGATADQRGDTVYLRRSDGAPR